MVYTIPSAKRILIVEDNKAMAATLAAKLGQNGFDTIVANDGARALDRLRHETFDLIILDLMLPKVTGFDVLAELEKQKNNTPVIVATDLGQEDDCIKALALGAKDYFIKAETAIADLVRYVQKFLADPKKISRRDTVGDSNTPAGHQRATLAKATLQKYLQEIEPLKKSFNLLNDHVIITDAHANILYANKAVERNTGFTIKEILGRNPADLWGGHMPRAFYERLWQTIKVDKKPFVDEVKNIAKDGQEYWQELHIAPILDSASEIRFFIGIEPNITDRKQKERFRNEFLTILGHQLKDPLAAVRWSLELLQLSKSCGPKEHEMLEQLYAENQNLISLITDLLVLNKLDADNHEKEKIDLVDLIDRIVSETKKRYPKLKIFFKPTSTPATKYLVHGHAIIVPQLFTNIIHNAAKYTPTKNGKVVITLTKKSGRYIFSCQDTGIGIPAQEQTHVFERFFRASNAKAQTGSGLGLFIAKLIADKYGWQISFTSTINKGTKFRVELPSIKARS